MNNQSFMTKPTLVDLYPDKYNQGLHYHLFMVNLGRYNESCDTLVDTCGRIYVSNKKRM